MGGLHQVVRQARTVRFTSILAIPVTVKIHPTAANRNSMTAPMSTDTRDTRRKAPGKKHSHCSANLFGPDLIARGCSTSPNPVTAAVNAQIGRHRAANRDATEENGQAKPTAHRSYSSDRSTVTETLVSNDAA
jgi:hypothetical protein